MVKKNEMPEREVTPLKHLKTKNYRTRGISMSGNISGEPLKA